MENSISVALQLPCSQMCPGQGQIAVQPKTFQVCRSFLGPQRLEKQAREGDIGEASPGAKAGAVFRSRRPSALQNTKASKALNTEFRRNSLGISILESILGSKESTRPIEIK